MHSRHHSQTQWLRFTLLLVIPLIILSTAPPTTQAGGGNSSLTIIKNANIIDENDFDFTITGPGLSPEFALTWGDQGSGPGQFNQSGGVAVDSAGHIYVTDPGNNRVQKFDSQGVHLLTWEAEMEGASQFNQPVGVAVDGNDHVYVADTGHNRIQKFDSKGAHLLTWGGPGTEDGQFVTPFDIAVDKAGHIYVTDTGNSRVQKFDSNGVHLLTWGGPGIGDGQFMQPAGVGVDSAGNVYVTDIDPADPNVQPDSGNDRVQKFDSQGNHLLTWGGRGSGPGQFIQPAGVTVDDDGIVYVTDLHNHRLQKFDGAGRFLTAWGLFGSGPGQFFQPSDVATADNGLVYVTDTLNHRVQKFGPNRFILNNDLSGGETGPSKTFGDLAPGRYTINEEPPDGWGLLSVTCLDAMGLDVTGDFVNFASVASFAAITVAADQELRCIFFNERVTFEAERHEIYLPFMMK